MEKVMNDSSHEMFFFNHFLAFFHQGFFILAI